MASTPTDLLLSDLETFVRSNGVGGKTTAQDLRTFLANVISALSNVLDSGIGAPAQPFRILSTLAQRDALTTSSTLNTDGITSGQRTAEMFVFVLADDTLYQLHIPDFFSLPREVDKVNALSNNDFWVEYTGKRGAPPTGFVNIASTEIHPAFTTQHELNLYLLRLSGGTSGNAPAAPTIVSQQNTIEGGVVVFEPTPEYPSFRDYEYRFIPNGQPSTTWQRCLDPDFVIALGNDNLAPGSVQVRVIAADGNPAGVKALNTVAFTQYFYPIMVDMPVYNSQAQTLKVTTRNDGDGHTQVIIDGNLIGYVAGPINQYNTNTFSLALAPGDHTIICGDGRGTYATPVRTFTVSAADNAL